jgi:hypothetical protein
VRFRVIAAGFALGALAHATELMAFLAIHYELMPGYPPWRHIVFTAFDSTLAALALYAPRRLWMPVLVLCVQQVTTHGVSLWDAAVGGRPLEWSSVTTLSFVAWSTAVALMERFRDARHRSH